MDAAQLKEHTLNRLGYGNGYESGAEFDEWGFEGYVDRQTNGALAPLDLADPYVITKILAPLGRNQPREPIRQLELVLIDFWFNHFNIDSGSNTWLQRLNTDAGRGTATYFRDVIAPNVLGDFKDMLIGTAKSVSMLDFLDNRFNFAPSATGSLNENYAREVMELHTVGATGGYNDADVADAARILTGWSYPFSPRAFTFMPEHHDFGAKTVMGVDYPAGRGLVEGEEFLEFLADHPSTANFLAYKLCRRFVSETPSASVVAAAANAYTGTRDLKAVTLAIINHPDFVDVANFRSKIKPPHRFVASALMALGLRHESQVVNIGDGLVDGILQAGERPYFYPSPNGTPETSAYWVSTSSMVARFEMAALIANDPLIVIQAKARAQIDGTDVAATVGGLAAIISPGGMSATTIAAATQHATNAAMPDERVSAAIYMLLSSPEFLRY